MEKLNKNQEKLLRKIIKAQENLKTQGKTSKLKDITQNSRKNSNFRHIHMLAMRKMWPICKPVLCAYCVITKLEPKFLMIKSG